MQIPDTPLCEAVRAHAASLYTPVLFNHATRSYVFAAAAGRAGDSSFDPELLYVACLFHDLGLTDVAPVQTRFEVEGADAARTFLAARGVGEREQELIWDAIALHTTLVIPQRKAPEIALCQLGTAIDVGFAPRSLISANVVAEALTSFPRLDFKRALPQALCSLLHRNRQAAALSDVVGAVGERMIPDFRRPHACDVIAGAAFDE